MIYNNMAINAQGDVTFYLDDVLVAVVGHAFNLGDYVIVCKLNNRLEHIYIRVGSSAQDKAAKIEIARAILKAYLVHLVGHDNYTVEFLTQGIIKINEDPYSLNQHITINSKLVALVLKSTYSASMLTPTTVAMQSTPGSVYRVDIMDDVLIDAVGTQESELINTALWLSYAYEQWRHKSCT